MTSKNTINSIPKTLAIIPDGNRRYAKKKGISLKKAYSKGIQNLGNVLKWARKYKIKKAIFWGFSLDNLKRDKTEIDLLFSIFLEQIKKALKKAEVEKKEVKVRFIGNRKIFPEYIQEGLKKIEEKTRQYKQYSVDILLGYSGKYDVNEFVKKIRKTRKKQIKVEDFFIVKQDPDLIIRTSGEKRLSGFLPFNSMYSELYFSKKLWPEFDKQDFDKAIADYSKRKRRFGK